MSACTDDKEPCPCGCHNGVTDGTLPGINGSPGDAHIQVQTCDSCEIYDDDLVAAEVVAKALGLEVVKAYEYEECECEEYHGSWWWKIEIPYDDLEPRLSVLPGWHPYYDEDDMPVGNPT